MDVHHPSGGGFLFKYLDGTTEDITAAGVVRGRWRGPVAQDPTFYRIPYRIMVHRRAPNAIMAGRMVAADAGAYGASMSSNYNSRPLIPEVLVDGDTDRLIRRRQTVDELLALEQV